MIRGLAKNFKAIVFDNRGAGRSEMSDRLYTIELLADDTAGLMEALKISRAHILGISMGGMIAQELVIKYPEKVEKLVLCSTTCGGPKSIAASQEVLDVLTTDVSKLSAKEVATKIIPFCVTEDFLVDNPGLIEVVTRQILRAPISKEAYRRQLNAIIKFDTYGKLSQIKAQTLVLHGKRDMLVPPENGLILAKAIPNARLVTFEKSAHLLVEDMEEVANTITEFLL